MTDDHADLGGRAAGTDVLGERLRGLHVDTDPVILSESSAVRRRGDRRRRATRAGTVLGVAVLAVGAVGLAGTLTDRPSAAPPAGSAPSLPSRPAPSLATNPFLTVGDLSPIGPNSAFTGGFPSAGEMRLTCLSDPASWGSTTVQSQAFASDLDATFVETVLEFPDEISAKAAAQRPLEEFAACPKGDPAEATVADRSELLAVGNQAYRLSRSTTPTADADLGYNEVAVARNGTVVIVLDWSSQGSPVAAPGWAWTPEQVTVALDRAVG